jgi:TPR repeat protein
MEKLIDYELQQSFVLFEIAAAKGHADSIWITSVVKDVEMRTNPLQRAFAKTEKPLGWYFAGKFSSGREQLDFMKKSAEGGCSWGQFWLSQYFEPDEDEDDERLGADENVFLEWLKKAADQKNPKALDCLGDWFRGGKEKEEKAIPLYRAAAELGCEKSMGSLAVLLKRRNSLREAIFWSAQASAFRFWEQLEETREASKGTTEDLDYDFNQLCYTLGWGLYWHRYNASRHHDRVFVNACLNYYCSCFELQQKSILTFLWWWNRSGGVKDVGVMLGRMVWEKRDENLLKPLEPVRREEE